MRKTVYLRKKGWMDGLPANKIASWHSVGFYSVQMLPSIRIIGLVVLLGAQKSREYSYSKFDIILETSVLNMRRGVECQANRGGGESWCSGSHLKVEGGQYA